MCGIAGAVGASDPTLASRMVAALAHRGPDGSAHWSSGAAQLGFARLSIVDPSAGTRPITNEDGRISIAFNGEIYNHRELRAGLERRGHVFRTRTDTEVIVHLYEEAGPACVDQLRGMFAFAIADGERLVLARDRLGIKPLHWTQLGDGGPLLFASELKGLLQCHELTPGLDLQALADSLVLGYAAADRTFLEGVRLLPAGHVMTVTCGPGRVDSELRRYFRREPDSYDEVDLPEAQAALAEALDDAVARHLDADVEVALTLSGGLDSTMLALIAQEVAPRQMRTFTLADHPTHPDLMQARDVASSIGSAHEDAAVSFDEYLAAIPGFVAAEEQPTSLYGLPFYLLSRRVAAQVKACLHGEGADELFGGYREYLDRLHRTSAMGRRLPLLKRLGVPPSDETVAAVERLSSARTFDDYLAAIFEVNLGDALERLHLDVVDKSSMAAGLEIRVPYLDDRVYELVSRMPLRHRVRADIGIRKYVLRRLCLERFGLGLTDVVLREKLGVPSAGVRHLERFERLCDEMLPEDYLEQHPLGFCFGAKRQLLMLEMFCEIFVEHRGDSNAVGSVLDFMAARGAAARDGGAVPSRVGG